MNEIDIARAGRAPAPLPETGVRDLSGARLGMAMPERDSQGRHECTAVPVSPERSLGRIVWPALRYSNPGAGTLPCDDELS